MMNEWTKLLENVRSKSAIYEVIFDIVSKREVNKKEIFGDLRAIEGITIVNPQITKIISPNQEKSRVKTKFETTVEYPNPKLFLYKFFLPQTTNIIGIIKINIFLETLKRIDK